MPKLNWDGDDMLEADDVENAEDGYAAYTGDLPPGGVYRFTIGRMKFKEASTGKQGLNLRLRLDGSWKPQHKKFDGYVMWDNIWMSKASAAFVKAFANAIGVSANDLINGVVLDEDDYVTKIGKKRIKEDDIVVYIATKRDESYGDPRLIKAGTGFQVIEADEDEDEDDDEEEEAPPPRKAAKATPAKAAAKSSKRRPEPEDDDEEDEDEDEDPPAKPAKKTANSSRNSSKGKAARKEDDEPPF